jgi:hypothetical protein
MPFAQDYSYIGSGNIYLREYGSAAPFVDVGNCSALTVSPQEEEKTLADYTAPGGGTRNEVRRLTGVEVAYTFHDFSPENFKIALRGESATVTAGTATEEEVVAYKGGFTPLAKIPTAITTVIPAGGGAAYSAGTDYVLQDGGIYIPSGSTIPDPVAGAANIEVTYTYGAQKKVEALVNGNKQYELLFVGLNEARSSKKTRVTIHKVSAGVLQAMALLGDDFGAGEVTGKALSDTTKSGVGISKYMTIEIED